MAWSSGAWLHHASRRAAWTTIALTLTATAGSACREPGRVDSRPYRLTAEPEGAFGAHEEPADAVLGRIAGVCVREDRVFVGDASRHRVVAFEPTGDVAWTAGRRGEGPGEFTSLRHVVCTATFVAVGDHAGMEIEAFGYDGNYEATFDLSALELRDPGFAGSTNSSRLLALGHLSGRIGADVKVVDLAYTPARSGASFEILLDVDVELPRRLAVRPEMHVARDRLIVGGVGRLHNEIRRLDGGLERQLTAEPSALRAPVVIDDDIGVALTTPGEARPAVPLAGGYWLVYSRWPEVADVEAHLRASRASALAGQYSPTPLQDALDLFSTTGRHLGRWSPASAVPGWTGAPVAFAEDAVYTVVDDPWPMVHRLRIQVTQGR